MMFIVTATLSFILCFFILVTVHEFGHYWMAKKMGVKVLNFSIGFGYKIISWQRAGTTFSLSLLPLGGYVKMLESTKDNPDQADINKAYDRQNVYKRMAIVLAGPLSNLLFAILLYTIVYSVGVSGLKPIIGNLTPYSIAADAGLKTNDQITHINDKTVTTVNNLFQQLIKESFAKTITVTVKRDKQNKQITLALPENWLKQTEQNLPALLGFHFQTPQLKPIIAKVLDNSPAQIAGLKAMDEIIKINDDNINTWQDLATMVQNSANQAMQITLLRDKQEKILTVFPKQKNEESRVSIGVHAFVPKDFISRYYVKEQNTPITAFLLASNQVYYISKLTLQILSKMIIGEASLKHISGPIRIANYAGQSTQLGITTFLNFMALLSVSIAVLNLLPIPMLDGGHFFYYLIEVFKGSPVSENIQLRLQTIGMLFILLLISVAVYNDVFDLLSNS